MNAETYDCCGVPIAALSPEDAVFELLALAKERRPAAVHLCNSYTLSIALRDSEYASVLRRADLNLPDGTPVAWASRLRRDLSPIHLPVRGPGLMRDVLREGLEMEARHYFYGGSPRTALLLPSRVRSLAPGVRIAGIESPPYRPLRASEEDALVERIRAAEPDFVWVGLGTPNQDIFVDRFRDRLDTVLVAVGAAFDFVAGTRREAPHWLHGSGFEWVFRLGTEPRRLWRRYLFGNAAFARGVYRQARGRRP